MVKNVTTELDERMLQLIVASAASVDPEKTEGNYELAVVKRMLEIEWLLSPEALTSRVARASKTRARIVQVSYNGRMRRYEVSYTIESNTETMSVLSDRVDDRNGELVRAMWTQPLQGKEVILFKLIEPSRGGFAPAKIQCCPYIIVLGD